MNSPIKKDGAFLKDVQEALDSGNRALWWLGQSGFLVVHKGSAILLDPYLSDSLTKKYAATDKPHVRLTERVISPEALARAVPLDVITSSHNHTDHLDPETLLPLLDAQPKTRLLVAAANKDFALERLGQQYAARLVEIDDGQEIELGGVAFHGIASAHPKVQKDEKGRCLFLGYVLRWDELTIYHSGDTMWHEGFVTSLKGFKLDVALLPISGDKPERRVAGNLSGVEAARLAHEIGAGLAIPCHYDMFAFNTASPDEFVAECRRLGQLCHVLENGGGIPLRSTKQKHPTS